MAKIESALPSSLEFVEALTYWNYKTISSIEVSTKEELSALPKNIVYKAVTSSIIPFWIIAYGNINSNIEIEIEKLFEENVTQYFSNEIYLKNKIRYIVKGNALFCFCDTEEYALCLLEFFSQSIEIIKNKDKDSITLKAIVDYTN